MEKLYGIHTYKAPTWKCACGCSKGDNPGGPLGLDPDGTCPCHPMDGKFLGGNADYEYVVRARIAKLEKDLAEANALWRAIGPSKKTLAAKLEAAEKKNRLQHDVLNQIRALLD